MPRPVSLDAGHISPENFLQLMSMSKQCENMVGQLNAIRTKKPGMYKAAQTQHIPAQQQQPVVPQLVRQQPIGAMGPPAAAGGYAAAAATPEEVVSRPTAAPSPMGAGAAPSPAPGAAATAATPPIGAGGALAVEMIKPDMPPAPVLPATVGSAEVGKTATTHPGLSAAAVVGGQAAADKGAPSAAVTAVVEKQPSAGPRALISASVGTAADTPLGGLSAALTSATEAQLTRAAQLQARALGSPAYAACLGPLPSLADFAAAAAAATGAVNDNESDGSAATVDAALLDMPGWRSSAIIARTLSVCTPEGYHLPERSVASASALTAVPADAAAAANRKRLRQDVEQVCRKVEAALEGLVGVQVLPQDESSSSKSAVTAGEASPPAWGADSVQVCIECLQSAALQSKGDGDAQGSKGANAPAVDYASRLWKRLRVMVPDRYPTHPCVAVFSGPLRVEPSVEGGSNQQGASDVDDALQHQWAEEAWSELQAALWEDPVGDIQGLAERWCQAVGVVALQHNLQ